MQTAFCTSTYNFFGNQVEALLQFFTVTDFFSINNVTLWLRRNVKIFGLALNNICQTNCLQCYFEYPRSLMFIFGFYRTSCITKIKLNLFENKKTSKQSEKLVLEYICVFAGLNFRNDSLTKNKSLVHLCSFCHSHCVRWPLSNSK